LPEIRVGHVKDDDADVRPAWVLQDRAEEEWICLEKIDVRIAEARVELQRAAGVPTDLQRDLGEPVEKWLFRETCRAAVLDALHCAPIDGGGFGGRPRSDGEARPVRDDALEAHRALSGSEQALAEGAEKLLVGEMLVEQRLSARFDSEDL